MHRGLGLVLCTLAVAGCARLGFDRGQTASKAGDATVLDGPRVLEVGAAEGSTTSDLRSDLARPDLARPDLGKPDLAKPDLAKPSKDGPAVASGCALGAAPVLVYSSAMQVCPGAVTQCQAESLCDTPGWHLCTADEFVFLGGTTIPSATKAWIASCVRTGDVVTAPTEQICPGTCGTPTVGTSLVFGFTCSGGSASSGAQHPQGVQAGQLQHRVGAVGAACAYWEVGEAMLTRAAVCCLSSA